MKKHEQQQQKKNKGFVIRHIWVKLQPLQNLTLSPWSCPFILWGPQFPPYKMGEALVVFLVRNDWVKEHEVLTNICSMELNQHFYSYKCLFDNHIAQDLPGV